MIFFVQNGMTRFKNSLYLAIFFVVAGCTKNNVHPTATEDADTIPAFLKERHQNDVVDLYIFAGQSNCGRPQFPGNGATGPVATTAQLSLYDSAIRNFQIYNPGYDTLAFHDLQAGINTMLVNYLTTTEMGAEVSFFKAMKDSSGLKEAYLIKYGYGNTDLAESWLNVYKYDLYRYTDKAIRLLVQQKKIPVLKGFIWMQGENDATDSIWASQYQANLQTFFSGFDQFYTADMLSLGLGSPPYIKVIGRINGIEDPSEIYRNAVRSGEESFCVANQHSFLINTDNYPLFGGVHYTLSGQIQFGLDIYDVLK